MSNQDYMNDEIFKKLMSFIFKSEGGYVNHPNDRGGPTNMGVTQATFNDYRIKNKMPGLEARNQFYKDIVINYRTQNAFSNGWDNRVKHIEDNATKLRLEGYYKPKFGDTVTPFDEGYSGGLKNVRNEFKNSEDRERAKTKYIYKTDKNPNAAEFIPGFYRHPE